MKKLIIILCIFALPAFVNAQTCEQRESKLLETLGSFSAAFLYNSYGMIGGVADGYGTNTYTTQKVNELMDEQATLIDNLVKVLNDLKSGGFLKDKQDVDYVNTANSILNGLKRQTALIKSYVASKSDQNWNSYDEQRKKNWKDIAKLMGIE